MGDETMTIDDGAEIADAYDEMIARAVLVVKDAPYFQSIWDEQYARLLFHEDDTATLRWPHATTEWDSAVMEHESVNFPATLLFVSDAELATWKKEQRALYNKQQRERDAERRRAYEEQERATLAALKRKYETAK